MNTQYLNMKKIGFIIYFTSILFLCYHSNCNGQEILLEKVKEFMPDSIIQSEIRIYEGDLNRDNFQDIIMRFKIKNESEVREHIYLFTGQENEKFLLAAKNNSLELDNSDGTVFDNIVIKNGYFSLEYRGYGNNSGSYDIITFKYSKIKKKWILHRHGSMYAHRFSDGEPIEYMSTQKDFGKIFFEDYR